MLLHAMKFLIFCFILFHPYIQGVDQDTLAKRIHAHLLIHDTENACHEAVGAIRAFPQDQELWGWYIKALAAHGDEKEMYAAWQTYVRKFPEPYKNMDLLEAMAWGVIAKGSRSPSPLIRTCSIQGAFFGQDAKGVAIIHRHFTDENSHLRWAAVKLSGEMRDAKLGDAVYATFMNEKVGKVRLEAIKAVGTMQIRKAMPTLMAIASNSQSTAEEKCAAIQSIVEMTDSISYEEVHRLAQSDRAGLRLIACQLIEMYEMKSALADAFVLLNDPCGEVRAATLHAIGMLRVEDYGGQRIEAIVGRLLNDPAPEAAIMAAWVMTLHNPMQGLSAFQFWLKHEQQDIRLLAAAALTASGKHGVPLMQKIFETSADPYVKMNVALGLIGHRVMTQQACDTLCNALTMHEKWMWKETEVAKIVAPSDVKHDDEIPQYPEAMDQLVRLEVLNTVAMLRHPQAQAAVANILKQKVWGVTGIAAAVLLTECDEDALELVRAMLRAPEYKVRIQAGLILAMWGRDKEAIETLQNAYETADRQIKEKILEGIGHIGARESIPFLLDKLNAPSQSLRIMAASALLQTLYH